MDFLWSNKYEDGALRFKSVSPRFGTLGYSKKMPHGIPTGVIIFFHGVKQHGLSTEVVALRDRMMAATNCAWYSLDLHGHGKSGTAKPGEEEPNGLFPVFGELKEDLLNFISIVMASEMPGFPFVLSGHSFGGGCVAALAPDLTELYGPRFRGMMLSAPLIQHPKGGLSEWPALIKRTLLCLRHCFPNKVLGSLGKPG